MRSSNSYITTFLLFHQYALVTWPMPPIPKPLGLPRNLTAPWAAINSETKNTLLQVSRDGVWVDGGEFLPLLGSFATIPKAKRGLQLNHTHYCYLDVVHMDIAFGDCLLDGGYSYTLILVDRAMHYNLTFGLKSLSSECILSTPRLFRVAAGAHACCFYRDCNAKLFGLAISDYLIDNNSKVIANPAKWQSSNGLMESHQKIMVHMAQAYLTKKQMPHNF
jgi:hypothetical protein